MKQILLLLLLSAPTLIFSKINPAPKSLINHHSSFITHQGPGLDAIKTALGAGNVDDLLKFIGESVEISISDKEQVYSKTQAGDALRSFFGQNKPKSFSQMHQGSSREKSDQYCIGSLATGGATWRVYIYLKTDTAQTQIREIRFDKE